MCIYEYVKEELDQSSTPLLSGGLPASQLQTPVLCFCAAWITASSEAGFWCCRRSSSFCKISIDWSFCLNSATSTCVKHCKKVRNARRKNSIPMVTVWQHSQPFHLQSQSDVKPPNILPWTNHSPYSSDMYFLNIYMSTKKLKSQQHNNIEQNRQK